MYTPVQDISTRGKLVRNCCWSSQQQQAFFRSLVSNELHQGWEVGTAAPFLVQLKVQRLIWYNNFFFNLDVFINSSSTLFW